MKRLIPKRPNVFEAGIPDRMGYVLADLEEGLIRCGAKSGIDYTIKDLILLACHLDAFDQDSPKNAAITSVASAISRLGLGSVHVPGPIEYLGMQTKEIADALSALAEAVSNLRSE